jgi:PiT family inorganic phosphate transporter
MEFWLVVSCLLVAVTIGANDIANAIGTTVGSNILTYHKASALAGASVALGALLAGQRTIDTVGKGILDSSLLSVDSLAVALACAAFSVAIATYFRYPVSTTQAVVGARSGTGIAAGMALDSSVLRNIAVVWTALPVFSALVSIGTFYLFRSLFRRLFMDRIYLYERAIALLVIVSGILVAFSLGSNNIGNAVGVLVARDVMGMVPSVVAGALFISIGAIFFSKRVILTIGKGITTLDPLQAFVVQTSSALALFLCTLIGVPVSLSQATVGCVVGVGLTRGPSALNRRFVLSILGSWVATPLVSGLLAYAAFSFTG